MRSKEGVVFMDYTIDLIFPHSLVKDSHWWPYIRKIVSRYCSAPVWARNVCHVSSINDRERLLTKLNVVVDIAQETRSMISFKKIIWSTQLRPGFNWSLVFLYIISCKIISKIAPGIPNMPTNIEVKKLIPIENPHAPPIKLII